MCGQSQVVAAMTNESQIRNLSITRLSKLLHHTDPLFIVYIMHVLRYNFISRSLFSFHVL